MSVNPNEARVFAIEVQPADHERAPSLDHLRNVVLQALSRSARPHLEHLNEWELTAIIVLRGGGAGDVLAIRARHDQLHAPIFPWAWLDQLAQDIARATWRITSIVPDIQSAPPRVPVTGLAALPAEAGMSVSDEPAVA